MSEYDWSLMSGTVKSDDKQAVILAVTHDSRQVVGQARQVGHKSSEIPVVRELLKSTGLDQQKVTLDAHHCNPVTTAQNSTSGGGTYLIQVKENQPTLLQQCRGFWSDG